MKWKTNFPPTKNENRIINRFLIIPHTLVNPKKGELETRWLEWAKIRQIYRVGTMDEWWDNKEWAD